jgi:hypothetical protein
MASSMRTDEVPRCNVIVLTFSAVDVPNAAGTANTVASGNTSYLLPFSGSIVSIMAASNDAFTGGTVTFRPTVNGTANTTLTTALSSSVQQNYVNGPADQVRFAAGDRIGVDFTKSGTVAPITNDVIIMLFVLVENMPI